MYDYISDTKAMHRPSKVYGTNTNIPYMEIAPNILDICLAKSQYTLLNSRISVKR